ncbi:Uncharacterized protein PCOAH_00018840 [Plasmodium coatneyi]|uniref:Tyrosine-protein kinase ephrin type A/B receptor-like domain-containing protein n=1 Tax=Plasmodium coatneyi TaxID=208452 RepID=A0A1B1DX96_9APIC|nr:Uncharacterized protein PCOAH_00018840 [Plasmodium coatneyi]ANQ07416.1 Uncharacterized protein PCOAH_00018840 [Plasmodium coatneyi]
MSNLLMMGAKFALLMSFLLIRGDTEIGVLVNKLSGDKKARLLSVTVSSSCKSVHSLFKRCNAGEMLTYVKMKRAKSSSRLCVDLRNHKCEKCKKGFYNFSRDNKICVPCPLGTFSDAEGSIVCRNCPSGSTTKSTGSEYSQNCVCSKGLSKEQMKEQMSFKVDPTDGRCVKCSALESCDDGENVWSFKNMCTKEHGEEYVELCRNVRTGQVYSFQISCFKKDVCLNHKEGKSCLEGNKLIQCKICDENFRSDFVTPVKRPCVLCSFTTYVVSLYFVTLGFFLSILILTCTEREREMKIIRLVVKYTRYMSLLRYVNSNYSHFLLDALHFFTVGVPLNEVLDCIFTRGTNGERIEKKVDFLLYLPLLFLVFPFFGTIVLRLLRKQGKDELNNNSSKSGVDNIPSLDEHKSSLTENNKRKAQENGIYFAQFFILYHEYLYLEIIRLCVFFYFCNYDEQRRGDFLIADDSLECTKMRRKYYVKIWIIVLYNTFVNYFDYFLFFLKKYIPSLDVLCVLKGRVSTLSPLDDFFMLLFLFFFHKRFFNNVKVSLIVNHKNGIYNNNVHTFQFVVIAVSFSLYTLITFLCVYQWDDYVGEQELSELGNRRNVGNIVKTSPFYEEEEGRKTEVNKSDVAKEKSDNNDGEAEKVELKNGQMGVPHGEGGEKDEDEGIEEDTNEHRRGTPTGGDKQDHPATPSCRIQVVKLLSKYVKERKTEKFFFYFSMLVHVTISLSYYTFLSYVHGRNFLGVLTTISVLCNGLIYAIIFFLLIKLVRGNNLKKDNRKWFRFSGIRRRIGKAKWVAIWRRKTSGTEEEQTNRKHVVAFKQRNKKMEEKYFLKNEKRSIMLINNILKSSKSFKVHFGEVASKSENDNSLKNKERSKFMRRYKLLGISKKWIMFLQNVVDLSDEPEKCLSMLISLTLEKEFPSLDLDACLEIVQKNYFSTMKNVPTILKNFLKYTNKFLAILERRKKGEKKNSNGRINDCDESAIIFAWGLSILSFGNLQDVNYNLSLVLFHVSNVLAKCRYMKYIMDYYFRYMPYWGVIPFAGLGNYYLPRETTTGGTLPICDTINNRYGDQEGESNFNRVDPGRVDNQTVAFESLGEDRHPDGYINGKNEQLNVDAPNQQACLGPQFTHTAKMESYPGELGTSPSGCTPSRITQSGLSNRRRGTLGKRDNQAGDGLPLEFELNRIYAKELCRIYVHCLLADVSEMYKGIQYTQTCEKYLCSGVLNLWGEHHKNSSNMYMRRYYEHLERWAGLEVNTVQDPTEAIFNIEDYISSRVIEIDFYGQFEHLKGDTKNYLMSLIKEGDSLHVKELTNFSEIPRDRSQEMDRKEKEEKEKKRKRKNEQFCKVFCSALPVCIEKRCWEFLDKNELKQIEEEKRQRRNFTISCENMGEEYFNVHVLKNYEEKVTYFKIDCYGGVISVGGEFVNKKGFIQNVRKNNVEKGRRKTATEGDKKDEANFTEEEDDKFLTEESVQMLNTNMYNYINYERVEGSRMEIFTHNSYEGDIGITGDLKGMNFHDRNALLVLSPTVVIPAECTIEVWLFVGSRRDTNGLEKSFLFCDMEGNSPFVISRRGNKIEDIEIHISDKRRLSSYFRQQHNEGRGEPMDGGETTGKENLWNVYIKCEKTPKWNKINSIVKQNEWNLLNITKCASGIIYYINGKYMNSVSHEVLNLEKELQMSIFGNSCFGNNNIGLCSSFKIFEFLKKEEIKRRYQIVKKVKGREMVGDNLCMEMKDQVIEGIDVRDKCMQVWEFFIYFTQSQKEKTRVVALTNDSNYRVKIYQLRLVPKYTGATSRGGENSPGESPPSAYLYERNGEELHSKGNKLVLTDQPNGEVEGCANLHRKCEKIIHIDDKEEYGYNVYLKKVSRKEDAPKIYGINIFSDLLCYACDLSKFYNLILDPPLSIYNELVKPFGYTLCLWVFLPIEENVSFSSLVSGEKDAHICVFSDRLVIGCVQNYRRRGNNQCQTFYHSSGFSVKNLKRGWYYLTVVGTLRGQFYFINGCFKGHHNFCSFDDIKYVGNSSLFVNPFSYICFFKMVTKPLSVTEIMCEYACPAYDKLAASSGSSYWYLLFANVLGRTAENNGSVDSLSDKSTSSTGSDKGKYVHFEITEFLNVHIYPYLERKDYQFALSVTSIRNRKLFFFNRKKEQVNNLNIYLNVSIVLPSCWAIFAVINLAYVNKSTYHCLVGGQNGNSHVAIKGSNLALGVLTHLGEDYLQKGEILDGVTNGERTNHLLVRGSSSNDRNKAASRGTNKMGNTAQCQTDTNMCNKNYPPFHSSGYNLQKELNEEILLTTRCRQNEQTFFIDSHKVGVCKSCLSPICCIGNCRSVSGEYLSPFGFYKFVRVVFEDVTDEQVIQFYRSFPLRGEHR